MHMAGYTAPRRCMAERIGKLGMDWGKGEAADLSRRDEQMGLDTKVWSRCHYRDLGSFWKDRKAPM